MGLAVRWMATAGAILGIAEMLAGVALLVLRNDGAGGYGLLAIGAGTFGSTATLITRRTR